MQIYLHYVAVASSLLSLPACPYHILIFPSHLRPLPGMFQFGYHSSTWNIYLSVIFACFCGPHVRALQFFSVNSRWRTVTLRALVTCLSVLTDSLL